MSQEKLKELTQAWFLESVREKYSYRFSWMGRPIIQYPQDVMAIQEIIWKVKPDLVIETGIAHGGGLVLYASLLELLGAGRVVGVDIEIRPHNREAIEQHPMYKRIKLIEGSSIDPAMVQEVFKEARGAERPLLILDSNHTHDHVLAELRAYSPLIKTGSYVVVFDTVVEDLPDELYPNRPWGQGNNPKTAVRAFLAENRRFEVDRELEERLLVTVSPEGFLRCIADM